jgi:hypothetical protein
MDNEIRHLELEAEITRLKYFRQFDSLAGDFEQYNNDMKEIVRKMTDLKMGSCVWPKEQGY